MSELRFQRVVVLCDSACDIRLAVAEAADLAARLGVALRGVFLDDENLRRLAELPFGRHVSLSSSTFTEDLTAHAVASLTAALGAAMRRSLAETAEKLGLEWTFGSIRDLPAAAALAADEGDILVIERTARPFSGTWRPRSVWETTPTAFAQTVLFRGRADGGKGILVFLPDDADGRDRVLSAAAALALADEDIVVAGDASASGEIERAAGYFAAEQRLRWRAPPSAEDGSALMRFVSSVDPALVVLEAGEASPAFIEGLLAEGRRDVLLVR